MSDQPFNFPDVTPDIEEIRAKLAELYKGAAPFTHEQLTAGTAMKADFEQRLAEANAAARVARVCAVLVPNPAYEAATHEYDHRTGLIFRRSGK